MALTLPEPRTQLHKIADGMIARLRLAFPASHFEIQLMPAVPTKNEFDRITRRRPFIGIAWAGFKPDTQARTLKGDASFIVYLVVDNQTSPAMRFMGDARGVGLFGMITAASALLHGWTLEDVGSATVTEVESLAKEDWGDDATAIAGLGVAMPILVGSGFAAGAALDEFLRLNCAWLIPAPDGSPTVVTPSSPRQTLAETLGSC